MDANIQVGSRFSSYRELIDALNQYCLETNTKFWKRHAKTLKSEFGTSFPLVERNLLIYYEIDFACATDETRISETENEPCPAYFRFKISDEGKYLELIAMNDRHVHNLEDTIELSLKRQFTEEESDELADDVPRKIMKTNSDDEAIEIIEVHVDNNKEIEDHESQVKFTFRGLVAPTLTAFKDDLSLNLDIVQDYAKFLADSKIMGVLVNGTSGEGMSMNVEERKRVTEEWVKAVKKTDQHLMVQVGGAPLPDVLELARHAESIGVHSLLCLPDLYNKPTTSSDLIRYLKTVGAAAPNTPLLYYHIPSYTHVHIHMGQFLNDSIGKIPTFHGIKFTSPCLDEGVAAVKANDGKYAVFLGADQLMAGAYTLGFDSAIATTLNIFPQLGIDILEAVKQSKLDKARETQNLLTEVCSRVTKNGLWVPTMKVAMDLYTPIKVGKAREPLANITAEHIKEMEVTLRNLGINK